MILKKTFLTTTLVSCILGLSACNDDNKSSSNTTPPIPTQPESVASNATISSEVANIAVYGDVNKKYFSEYRLATNINILLLDDTNIQAAGFALDLQSPKTLDEVTTENLALITQLLKSKGATVNVLVNKKSLNAESEVANVTLDIQFPDAKTATEIRNLVLSLFNNNQVVSPNTNATSNPSTDLRLNLAFWLANNTSFIWANAYSTAQASQVNQTYGDVNIASALSSFNKNVLVNKTTDAFAQSVSNSNAVDILWNIDSSGSMAEEQTNLANGASQFFTALNKAGVDYRLAVNTHDADKCKSLRKTSTGAEFIDKNTTNAEAEWKALSQPGINDSGTETGFYCVREANLSNFDRANAKNIVVFVSDEPENETYEQTQPSGASSIRTFTDYKNYFLSTATTYFAISGTANIVRPDFSAPAADYSDPDFSCNGDGGSATGGAHFKDIAKSTGGSSASICADSASWSVMFDEIVRSATGLASSFILKQVPIPSSVQVKVNNNNVVRDTTHQNGFDLVYSNTNVSLVFYGSALPKSGDKIDVSYKYLKK